MNRSEVEELLNHLGGLSGLIEDLKLGLIALENTLRLPDRQRYDKELANLKARGGVTDGAVALEILRSKILPERS